jgi:hypothetical protein
LWDDTPRTPICLGRGRRYPDPRIERTGLLAQRAGWQRSDPSTGRRVGFNVERTCLKTSVRVKVYNEAFVMREQLDSFGRTTRVMLDLATPPLQLQIDSPTQISAALEQLRRYVWDEALPELNSILHAGAEERGGIRIGRLTEMGDPR